MSPLLTLATLSLLLLTSVPVPSRAEEAEDPSHGWNANIAWESEWSAALSKAKAEAKPVMLVIHRKWCGACKNLKPKFAASKAIEAGSADLVMVQSSEESEFSESLFSPDGGYVPRILFFSVDAKGEPVFLDQITQREDQYKYFHHDPSTIVKSMEAAVAHVKSNGNGDATPSEEDQDAKSEL